MNVLTLLIGLFFFSEGFVNVLFFRHFKQYKTPALFQIGRGVRSLLGFVTIIISVLWT